MLDTKLVGWLKAKFEVSNKQFLLRPKKSVGKPPLQEEASINKLLTASEETKKEISEMKEAQIQTNELLGKIAAWLKKTAPDDADPEEHKKKQNGPMA